MGSATDYSSDPGYTYCGVDGYAGAADVSHFMARTSGKLLCEIEMGIVVSTTKPISIFREPCFCPPVELAIAGLGRRSDVLHAVAPDSSSGDVLVVESEINLWFRRSDRSFQLLALPRFAETRPAPGDAPLLDRFQSIH